MSLTLRADDCNELQSMENWLNAGTSWSENHEIVDVEANASAPLFNHIAEASSTSGSPESLFDALRKGKEGIPTHTTFLKLDTVELCKDNPEVVFMRAGSSSVVGSSSNEEEVSVHTNMLPSSGVSVSTLTDRTASLDEQVLCMDADSPRGPLSPGALQLGKSPRRASIKRSFVDASEASWMRTADAHQTRNHHPAKLKQPKNGILSPEEILAPASTIAYAPPFAGMATSGEISNLPTPNPTAFLPGGAANVTPLLFPTQLTLPSVPSMEEIVQLRPKRRNVRISKDPQSVAARHRRERISDRVRVLQHFVPGGTKMDTASMLDEAIHYVKFLQQQLQTLERIGNMSDPRFMTHPGGPMMLPQVGVSTSMRPFDLNCMVYQSNPATTMTHPPSLQQPGSWSNTRVSNFCSSFSDSAQEQFCH